MLLLDGGISNSGGGTEATPPCLLAAGELQEEVGASGLIGGGGREGECDEGGTGGREAAGELQEEVGASGLIGGGEREGECDGGDGREGGRVGARGLVGGREGGRQGEEEGGGRERGGWEVGRGRRVVPRRTEGKKI